jgi:hypothetical protein
MGASDSHGQSRIADARVVSSLLIEGFGIPVDSLLLREKSNCTLVEVPSEFLHKLRPMIEASQPGRWQLAREHIVEGLLNRIHTLDPRGKLERRLARILRKAE